MFGIVVIGRNEGERLKACLSSTPPASKLVYVDSGSVDGSPVTAQAFGAQIVDLDLREPFTAARARNAGFRHLLDLWPDTKYVQFVDGDCVICPNWIGGAVQYLESHGKVCAVFGRRKERYPHASIYNQLCDWEWDDVPIGQASECGGDVMMRVDAFSSVSGFRADLIAGEEPELCLRLQRAGWQIWRIDAAMTVHDASMTRFIQWWRRTIRGGYALAQGAALHGAGPERYRMQASRRSWLWGFWIPIVSLASTATLGATGALIFLVYPLQFIRLLFRRGGDLRSRATLSFFQTLARFPEAIGQLRFLAGRVFNRQARIIEYK
jgi:GT2 family glycosyltransferase